jgi:hypothetical protein
MNISLTKLFSVIFHQPLHSHHISHIILSWRFPVSLQLRPLSTLQTLVSAMSLFTITFDSSSDGDEAALAHNPTSQSLAWSSLRPCNASDLTRHLAHDAAHTRLVHFQLKRHKTLTRRTHFTLLKDGVAVKCAKHKGSSEFIPIGDGSEFHYETNTPIATIQFQNKQQSFVLRRPDGVQLLVVNYSLPDGDGTPREVRLSFPTPGPGLPTDLVSRKPRKGPNGRFQLNLEGRFALRSIRNCLLVDANDATYLVAVKIGKNVLGLDARPAIDMNAVFAFGISCLVCEL